MSIYSEHLFWCRKSHLVILAVFFFNLLYSQDTIGLEEYKTNKMYNVVNASSEDNIITLGGYCKEVDPMRLKSADFGFCQTVDPAYTKVRVKLKENEVLSVGDLKVIGQPGFMQPLPITIMTVPAKMRAPFDNRPRMATVDFSNLGLNLDLYRHTLRRYFDNGKFLTHRSGIGIFLGPSVEKIDASNVRINLDQNEESKQLFISTGLTLTYSYNSISFILVPLGFDFATTSVGKKFRYDQKRWWGFGIGFRPEF